MRKEDTNELYTVFVQNGNYKMFKIYKLLKYPFFKFERQLHETIVR